MSVDIKMVTSLRDLPYPPTRFGLDQRSALDTTMSLASSVELYNDIGLLRRDVLLLGIEASILILPLGCIWLYNMVIEWRQKRADLEMNRALQRTFGSNIEKIQIYQRLLRTALRLSTRSSNAASRQRYNDSCS
ncbi:hypothetical protein OE88DRAFT_1350775 [Heliocybe sulcata]|uniref:Uncharacterized protein n=1 Tax=Heliocybe sulcata TaxID=5364 RepID=A0A5C3NB04_9AGAM|nr:hypothetical protein OE88DRAFT_1350775 [Heliocybe sulcata]